MITLVTSVDTEILTAQQAIDQLPSGFPPVRLAKTDHFQSSEAVTEFLDEVNPSVLIVRVLGGKQYFETGLIQCSSWASERNIPIIAIPGTRELDSEITSQSSVTPSEIGTVFEYFSHGGVQNFLHCFRWLADRYLPGTYQFNDPSILPMNGLYHPNVPEATSDLEEFREEVFVSNRPVIAVIFYRAHWISGNLTSVDALVKQLEANGFNPLPIFCYSIRKQDETPTEGYPPVVENYLLDADDEPIPSVIINTLSYHMGSLHRGERGTTTDRNSTGFLRDLDIPVIQAMTSSATIEEWQASDSGLSPRDTAMKVAMPEFDGQIIGNATAFRERVDLDAAVTGPVYQYTPIADRVESIVTRAARYVSLAKKENHEKKIAVLLTNFPSQNDRIGNAVGLDTPASIINILQALDNAGYETGSFPADGDTLIQTLIDQGGYDKQFLTREQMRNAPGRIPKPVYQSWFDTFPASVQEEMRREWDNPPGEVYRDGDQVYLAGIRFGNVFVGIQPPRGFGENPIAVYHSPDLVPTHHYVGFYRWLRDDFGADALIHAGKHGTLEWLPGKSVALSKECYPEVCNPGIPVFYPFIINDPGEGSQAKRRLHSVIINHLVPPMTTADTYGDLDRLQTLLDEYQQAEELDPKKLPQVRDEIWELILENNLHDDLGVNSIPEDFDEFTNEIDGYLCEIGALQIRGGLHVLGEPPSGEKLVHFVTSLIRLDSQHGMGIHRAIANEYNIAYETIKDTPGDPYHNSCPQFVEYLEMDRVHAQGDVVDAIESFARILIEAIIEGKDPEEVCAQYSIDPDSSVRSVLSLVADEVLPSIAKTTSEITNLLDGLDGEFIPPGPSGAPTRGMPELLPTGRNFYSVDIRAVPSPYAWTVGKRLADSMLEKNLEGTGEYPESIGIVAWGTSNMRTKGDDIAEILYLLGVKPEWREENRRIDGLDVIPLDELGRPRIDVTIRISGFFRDAFPHVIELLDEAVNMVAELDEPLSRNYVRKHVEEEEKIHRDAGMEPDAASKRARYRIFGSKPGTYGAGILPAINQRNWETDEDLASVYLTWGGYAYTDDEFGSEAIADFKTRLSNVDVAVQNQDNREHDIFDSDDYLQFHGGMIASIRALTDEDPASLFGDSSQPEDVSVRSLDEEARRVFRSRVVNPKWIEAMRDHGYKGALEMAATVDFLFGYDATAEVVADWMYEDVTEEYLLDEDNREFLAEKNPWAIRSMSERLIEAMNREMWEEPDDEIRSILEELLLENEAMLEGRQE